jgi:hypothetical protein
VAHVTLDPDSVFTLVTGVGRGTMVVFPAALVKVEVMDLKRFRVSGHENRLWLSAGRQDTDLVDWRAVRTEVFVVLDDGSSFAFSVRVAAGRGEPHHTVVYAHAPGPEAPALAEAPPAAAAPAPAPVAAARARRGRAEAAGRGAPDRREAELRARVAAVLALPTGRARAKGALEVSASAPVPFGPGRAAAKLVIRNRSARPVVPAVSARPGPESKDRTAAVELVGLARGALAPGRAVTAVAAFASGPPPTLVVSDGERAVDVAPGTR